LASGDLRASPARRVPASASARSEGASRRVAESWGGGGRVETRRRMGCSSASCGG
jgi:hypothetical protein